MKIITFFLVENKGVYYTINRENGGPYEKKRILSAIVMIIIFIPILLIGGKAFVVLTSLLAAMGLYELLKLRSNENKVPLFMRLCSYLMLIIICTRNISSLDFNYTLDYKMISLIIFLFLFPLVFYNDNKKYNITDALFLIGSVLFLGFSFNLLIIARNYDLYRIIYLLLLSTMTDTFALITGKLVGKHKLVPKISPNKTIEGLLGGVIMGTFIASSFLSRIYKSYYILSNDNSYYYSSKYCWPNRRPSIFNDKKIL